jgi:hypothetical protein
MNNMKNDELIQQDNISRFWQWVVNNQRWLKQFPQNRMDLYPKVIEMITNIDAGLVCDFEINPLAERQKIVISADGNQALFPLVMKVVGAAPTQLLPGYQVIAFRQPRYSHFNISFADITITSDQVMVKYHKAKTGKLIVTIGISGWDESLPGLESAGMVILDNAIGEYNTVTRVEAIKVQSIQFSQDQRQLKGWIPLIRFNQELLKLYGKD